MAVQFVNGYVLLPQIPEWDGGMDIILLWQTEIALAKRGHEDRASLRPAPQAQMAWQIITKTAMDGAALEDCVRAALRSGQACAPCFPRPSYVSSTENGGMRAYLETTQWSWADGDYLIAFGDDGTPYVSQVQSVSAAQRLQLTTAIPADATVVWPLVFGRLETEQGEQEGPDTLSLNCRLFMPAWRFPNASAAPVAYNGAPVVPPVVVTDWSDAVNRSFSYDPSVEQIGFGAETLEIEQSYVQHGVQMNTVLTTDSAISDVEAFLGALGGRRGNFWLPAQERAMIINLGLSSPRSSSTRKVSRIHGAASPRCSCTSPRPGRRHRSGASVRSSPQRMATSRSSSMRRWRSRWMRPGTCTGCGSCA